MGHALYRPKMADEAVEIVHRIEGPREEGKPSSPLSEAGSIEELRRLFDPAPFAVLAVGPKGLIEYVNRRHCEIFTRPQEYYRGKDFRATFGQALATAGLLERYDRLVERGEAFHATRLDFRRNADDASVAVSMRGYRTGRWILIVSILERVLADQQVPYLQLFENANDGVFILSRDGRFTAVNRRFSEMVGVPIPELIGKTTEIFLPGRFSQSLDRLERILREGRLGPYELEIFTPKGVQFVSLNGFALVEEGKPIGVMNIARDTTEEHRRAEELREARDKALESSRLKTSFLANVSHEIRTPLNVMLGYASLLADLAVDTGNADQVEIVQHMRRAGERLEETIDSILDISKIESGSFDVRPERVELAAAIERQISDFQPMARAKGLALSFTIGDPSAAVIFDPYCLDPALMNLLANAIKFTPNGDVHVELARGSDRHLCLHVRDTGLGIDADFLPRLCEPFAQEDSGFTRRFDGVGLGLALTKRYLELNGARLSAKSQKGLGSLFTIHFTTESAPPRPADVSPTRAAGPVNFSTALTRLRVLVVEDDEQTRNYMNIMLGKCRELSLAASADEALLVLAARQVDIVLMDISLKGREDGLALTRRLRSDPRLKNLAIIALTAHAFPEDRRAALAAGCDDYLAKPFTPRDLMARIAAVLPSGEIERRISPPA